MAAWWIALVAPLAGLAGLCLLLRPAAGSHTRALAATDLYPLSRAHGIATGRKRVEPPVS